MDILEIVSLLLLIVSIQLNIYLYFKIKKLSKSPPPQMTVDAQALLGEIASGQTILKIEVLNPEDFLLRRHR